MDYRPIALCSTHYKIIAKILCKRLRLILPNLISSQQSAFVAGRSISDNVLITHEILHYLRTSSAKKHCSMAIKTDMSKAYDRLEWSFLRNVLARFGFHPTWVQWIMECVSTVSYSYLINGNAKGHVRPSRGIRQGDPLSPYLFILCSEVLSGLCVKAQEQGRLHGISVARNSPSLNHLLFADDTMFFCKCDPGSCQELMNILGRYEAASGQSINVLKSAITFSSKTPVEVRRRIKAMFNIRSEGGTGKYLSLPEQFNRRKKDIFASIVDRIRQKSHSWSSRYLNGAGKLVLLKAILSAMPMYAMSCFKLPVSLCNQIQKILTRFWWDEKPDARKMSWVAWSKLTLPKRAGGLGVRDIVKFNDALLAKLAWRVLKFPTSLLSQTLIGKYCYTDPFLRAAAPNSASHGWRGVLTGREVLLKGLGWIVGTGENVKVWSEPWLSTSYPLCPIGPPTETNKDLRVADLIDANSKEWNLEAIRQHLPQYEEMIRRVTISEFRMRNEIVWLPERSGNFSTKTGYTLSKISQDQVHEDFNWYPCIWQVKTSPKLKRFLWKVKSNALPVGANLLRRGMEVNGQCKRCGLVETERHVLLQCPYASRVWDLVPVLFKPDPNTITSVDSLLQASKRILNLPPTGLNETALYPWIFWYMWLGRNKFVFENREGSEQEVVLIAIKEARIWQAAQQAKEQPILKKRVQVLEPRNRLATQCFVDAAWNASTSDRGFGCILKDNNGKVLKQVSSNRLCISCRSFCG